MQVRAAGPGGNNAVTTHLDLPPVVSKIYNIWADLDFFVLFISHAISA